MSPRVPPGAKAGSSYAEFRSRQLADGRTGFATSPDVVFWKYLLDPPNFTAPAELRGGAAEC